jgi:uncharacterized protein (DUF1330 family)
MAKGYWISVYRSVSDPDALAAYAKLAGPALIAGGGRFLARGLPAEVKENGLMQRIVVTEFDSVAQAKAAYDSPAYQEALKHLHEGAVDRDIRIVEGAE